MADGEAVTLFDIASPPEDLSGKCPVVYRDIRSRDDLRSWLDHFDTVFLFAALLQKGFQEDRRNAWITNVEGVLNVLAQFANSKTTTLPRLIFASTGGVYAWPPHIYPPAEDAQKAPGDLYSESKLAGETMISSAARSLGFPAFILRFFTVYGPGPSSGRRGHFVASCLERIEAGIPIIIHGDGHQTRDFTHISDIVEACRKVLNLPAGYCDCRTYNIGSGHEVSVRQVVEWMGEEIDGVTFHFDSSILPRPVRYSGDIGLARRELAYEPRIMPELGLRELMRIVSWSRKQMR
jgi:UDP-glucose 4-epimerase